MNKNELAQQVAEKMGSTKAEAGRAIDAVFEAIAAELGQGEGSKVSILGFGTFVVTKRNATQGRNPRTGEPIRIPAANQPKFKAGKGLKDAVNN